jgi:hypothetical protein
MKGPSLGSNTPVQISSVRTHGKDVNAFAVAVSISFVVKRRRHMFRAFPNAHSVTNISELSQEQCISRTDCSQEAYYGFQKASNIKF